MENNNKALILTSLNKELEHFFPNITNRKLEDLLIINSYGAEISQGYSCIIRNIILAVYLEKIEEIYIIGESNDKEYSINAEELLTRMEKEGINTEVIQTLNYIKAAGNDVMKWLTGSKNIESMIKNNMDFIHNHPLIPSSVMVHGYIINTKTKDYEACFLGEYS